MSFLVSDSQVQRVLRFSMFSEGLLRLAISFRIRFSNASSGVLRYLRHHFFLLLFAMVQLIFVAIAIRSLLHNFARSQVPMRKIVSGTAQSTCDVFSFLVPFSFVLSCFGFLLVPGHHRC